MNTADGMRKTLAEEFTTIHVLNLRDNQRTAGEQSRKEGGKVFGGGSRATVAITVLVKSPDRTAPAFVHYTDVGDYLTREEKLAKVAEAGGLAGLEPATLTPNDHGDWLNQRRSDFDDFVPLGSKTGGERIFSIFSGGVKTQRDAWVWNQSCAALERNVKRTINRFNHSAQSRSVEVPPASELSWSRKMASMTQKGKSLVFDEQLLMRGSYRPFSAQWSYNSRDLVDEPGLSSRIFPAPAHPNVGFYALNPGAEKPFALLMLALVPDLAFYGSSAGQFFSRWTWEPVDAEGFDFGHAGEVVNGYRRVDNITDDALLRFTAAYGHDWRKDDYNDRITLSGIPADAYRYMLGSRSAIEWIIDRYYAKTDKTSGIVNNPNDWSREVGNPRYIVDLLARVVTVSVEILKIVDGMPSVLILEEA